MAGRSYRGDFPILDNKMNGKRLAFLDSAASAQKPRAVIDAMTEVAELGYANIHRGLYAYSQELTASFELVRQKIADFIGAKTEREIIFTRNATEGINLVAQSWGRNFLKSGDEIILSEMEHHANIVPWQILRDQIGIVIKVIPVKDDGTLDLEAYASLLGEKTRLVSVVHVSNALGTINPVKDIIAKAKAFNPDIVTLVDGSQSVVHMTVDMQDIGCDFFVFTGHKLYGPTGVGVLYGRYALLEKMPPYQGGGDMIERVSFEKTTFKEPPSRFEAGTPAIVQVIGLGAAIDYVSTIDFNVIARHEREMLRLATSALQEFGGVSVYGQAPDKAGVLSFNIEGMHASDVGTILDQCGVAVRAGHHCCMPLMARFGVDATVRASFALYSVKDDIDQFVEGLKKARDLLQ